jgi:hypothetical protein
MTYLEEDYVSDVPYVYSRNLAAYYQELHGEDPSLTNDSPIVQKFFSTWTEKNLWEQPVHIKTAYGVFLWDSHYNSHGHERPDD